MTRALTTLAAAALAACAATSTAEASPRYIGIMMFTSIVSGACDWNPVGSRREVRFTPADVGDNGPDSGLSEFNDWGGLGTTLAGAAFDTTPRAVRAYDIWGGATLKPGVKVKFGTQVPATITPTSNFVTVTGTVQNWTGGPTCLLAFRMNVTRSTE